MSIHSKTRREAKKRKGAKERDCVPAAFIEPHAELRNQRGELLAGVVRRDGQWVLGMGGRIAGSSDSAARVFALIRRAASLHEQEGTPVRLIYSDALRDAANAETVALVGGFGQFERDLQQELNRGRTLS